MIEILGRKIEKEFVDSGALLRLEKIAAPLPKTHALVEIECRLDENDSEVDLILEINPQTDDRGILSGSLDNDKIKEAVAVSKEWRQIQNYARIWENPYGPLDQWVDSLYFEFDANQPFETIPVPNVFTMLNAPYHRLPIDDPELKLPDFVAVRESAKLFLGNSFSSDLENQILNCFESLFDGGRVMYTAFMVARGHEEVRFSVTALKKEVLPYLRRIGWDHSLQEIEETLDRYNSFLPDPVQFDFDIGKGVLPRFGLYFPLRNEVPRKTFLQRLVEEQKCSQVKADLLACDTSYRELNCFKLTCVPSSQTSAKGYLMLL